MCGINFNWGDVEIILSAIVRLAAKGYLESVNVDTETIPRSK